MLILFKFLTLKIGFVLTVGGDVGFSGRISTGYAIEFDSTQIGLSVHGLNQY